MNFADQLKAYPLKKIDAIVFDDSILNTFESIVKWECTKRTQRFEQRQLKGYFVYTNDGETEHYDFVSYFPKRLTNADLKTEYDAWCKQNKIQSATPTPQSFFKEIMKHFSVEHFKSGDVRGIKHIAIKK